MVRRIHIVFVLATLLLLGCKKGNELACFTSTGEDAIEERAIPNFSRLALYDNINVEITQDSFFSASVEAGENLLDGIELTVEDGTLEIRNTNSCNWARSFKREITVYLTLPDLDFITFHGAGTITTGNPLTIDSLFLECHDALGTINMAVNLKSLIVKMHTGAADLTFTGQSDYVFVFLGSVGFIDQSGLKTTLSHVNNTGIGDVTIGAPSEMNAEIYRLGSIFYRGDPQILNFTDNGEGKLVRLGD